MEALRRAVAGAFKYFDVFRSDANLDPLRDRADFQTLLIDLTFPADPFGR